MHQVTMCPGVEIIWSIETGGERRLFLVFYCGARASDIVGATYAAAVIRPRTMRDDPNRRGELAAIRPLQ